MWQFCLHSSNKFRYVKVTTLKWVRDRTGGKLVSYYPNKYNVILNMQQAVHGRCLWEILWQVGREMTWEKKKTQTTNKTKKPRTSYTAEYLARGFGCTFWWHLTISVQQQMLFSVLNQPGTVQLQITTNEINPGTWRSSRNRLLGTIQILQLITFRISFQLTTTSETDTSLPTPFIVAYSICQIWWTTWSWHRQVLFPSQLVRGCSKSYISPMAWN